MDQRICSNCKIEKPISQFFEYSSNRCKICVRNAKKKWKSNNKDKVKQERKRHYEKHKDEIKEKAKQYKEQNKDKIKEQHKKHYINNKEKINKKRSEIINCKCGTNITYRHYAAHKRSQKHIALLFKKLMNELQK